MKKDLFVIALFVVTGVLALGAYLCITNLPAIVGEFAKTPGELVMAFILGGLAMKIAEMLNMCLKARRLEKRHAKEKTRAKRARERAERANERVEKTSRALESSGKKKEE